MYIYICLYIAPISILKTYMDRMPNLSLKNVCFPIRTKRHQNREMVKF